MTTTELANLAWAQTWQLSSLIVVVAAVSRLIGRRRPHLAHVLWLVVTPTEDGKPDTPSPQRDESKRISCRSSI
jgi:hypothetical protein